MAKWREQSTLIEEGASTPLIKEGEEVTTQELGWRGLSTPLDNIGTPDTPEEISIAVQKNQVASKDTGVPYDDFHNVSEALKPTHKKESMGQLIGTRLKDGLWNNTIGGLVQTLSGRDSSYVHDRAYELVLQYEKENDFKFPDRSRAPLLSAFQNRGTATSLFEDQVNDWTQQLMLPPHLREEPYLKHEPQLLPFEDIESVLGPHEMETTGNKWVDGACDMASGLSAFQGKVRVLNTQMPHVPAWAAWEAVSVANGGKPGEVSSIYGALGFFGKIIPTVPGGVPANKMLHGAIASAVFGGTTAVAGGDVEEIVLNSAFPLMLAFMGITREEWQSAKPKSKLRIAQELRTAHPELEFESSAKLIKAMSDALPTKSAQGKAKSGQKLAQETRLKQLESQKKAYADKTRSKKLTPKQISENIKKATQVKAEIKLLKQQLEPVKVKGEKVTSELALGVVEKAVEARILNEGDASNLPQHAKANLRLLIKNGEALRRKSPERAMRIATGLEPAPPDQLSILLYSRVVESHALRMGNGAVLAELATSDMMNNVTRHAQEISALQMRRKYSGTGQIQDVIVAREGVPDSRLAKKVTKAQKAFDKAQGKVLEKQIDATIKQVSSPKVSKKVNTKAVKYGKRNKLVTKTEYEKLRAEIKAEQGALKTKVPAKGKLRKGAAYVPNAQDWTRMRKIGLYHLEAMGRNLAEWSKVMKKEFGDWVVPHLQGLWDETSKSLGKSNALLATKKIRNGASAGKPVEKLGVYVQRLAEAFVSQGITSRKQLINEVHKVLVQVEPGHN